MTNQKLYRIKTAVKAGAEEGCNTLAQNCRQDGRHLYRRAINCSSDDPGACRQAALDTKDVIKNCFAAGNRC
jgi:hypothetical protein